jgi:serine/threonine protein kinase
MPEFDAEMIVDQVAMIGLVTRDQIREARADAADGSPEAILRTLLRKGSITSWQVDKLKKGDPSGFFFGDSKVLFHLAEGTFARVYRGEHTPTKGPVAIKVLRQRFVSMPEAVDRFHKEAEAGIRLRHPNIVKIIDVGTHENRHYMIMEYVEGMNLRDFMRLRARIPTAQALPLMLGMAQGLKYSFDQGVTHRDIKGTNILISNSGVAKLVDFGLATIQSDESKSGVKSQRTVDYSALERTCNSPKGDPRSDIYFLGCVFYQMVTGQLAMPEAESKDMLSKMLKRSFGAIKPVSEQRYAPEEEMCRIIDKMMKIDLKARYQSIDDVVRDLEDYQAKLEAEAKKHEPAPVPTASQLEAEEMAAAMFGPANPTAPPLVEPEPEPEPAIPAEPEPEPLQSFEIRAITFKSVLCVESQSEIQDALRKQLSAMGYRVLLVADAEVAAERYCESPVDAVIFDTDGQGSQSLEAIRAISDKASDDGHDLVAIVLLGPRQKDLEDQLPTGEHIVVLKKPIKMKQIQEVIERLLPVH